MLMSKGILSQTPRSFTPTVPDRVIGTESQISGMSTDLNPDKSCECWLIDRKFGMVRRNAGEWDELWEADPRSRARS